MAIVDNANDVTVRKCDGRHLGTNTLFFPTLTLTHEPNSKSNNIHKPQTNRRVNRLHLAGDRGGGTGQKQTPVEEIAKYQLDTSIIGMMSLNAAADLRQRVLRVPH
ncbi:hypothetical protein [Pyrobaculum islandicum]|uniref:hypothetical protein n=1 Tax=Pyrobaculum islandicum TaxID=2277 RepID=UPI00069CC64C|nr:hypothetical protein [Pyrobaculum islandicum]